MDDLLNLPQLTVEKSIEDSGRFIFFVSSDLPPQKCCGAPRLVKNGTKRAFYLDLPIHGKYVSIWVNRRRWFCKQCHGTLYQDVPYMDKNHAMTERLVRFVERISLEKPFTCIANQLGASEGTIRLIFRTFASRELAGRRKTTPRWIGIGPVHYLNQLRTVITDVENKALLDFLPSPSEESVTEFLQGLPGKETIEWVTVGMLEPYRSAIKAILPQARMMVDRFHITKLANETMEQIRTELISPMYRGGLARNNRRRILRNPERLTASRREMLDTWLAAKPLLKAVFEAKERYRALWENVTCAEAETRYEEWKQSLPADLAEAFDALIVKTDQWREEILAFIAWAGPAHAYTECVRNLQQKLNRLGQGYGFEVIRAKWLLRSDTAAV